MDSSVLILIGGIVGLFIARQFMRAGEPRVVVVEVAPGQASSGGCLMPIVALILAGALVLLLSR